MAKITVIGDAMVVTSAQTLENIKKVSKYSPRALHLIEKDDDGNKNDAFTVGIGTKGSINQYGATFTGETRDEAKLATITLQIPAGVTDAKGYVEELVGVGIMRLNKVEAQISAALQQVDADLATIREHITIA